MTKKYPPTRLTASFIEKLTWDGELIIVRDTKVTGLMIAVQKYCKSFKVQKDLWKGQRGRRRLVKTVRFTLGTTEELTLEDAREQATEMLLRIRRGEDPNAAPKGESADGWTVEQMYREYAEDLRTRECAKRTIEDFLARLEKYLPKWKPIQITEIKRSMARDEHRHITKKHGPYTANQCARDFRASYNFALKVVDDPDALAANPISAVTFNKERASNRVMMPEELPEWWEKVQQIGNPLRRDMHVLGILSGLRPGTLVSLKRDWVDLEKRAICIPKMKSGRSFALPLSDYMAELVERIISTGQTLYPETEWLFPTRSRHQRCVIHTQVWKERGLPSQTGHILRHTYRTIAQRAGIDKIDARLLLDHAVPGIDGVYIHESALFDRLLIAQEEMTKAIFSLCHSNEISP